MGRTASTSKVAPNAQGAVPLDFKSSYDAGPGSALQSAIVKALRTEDAEADDSEVQFVVHSSERGKDVEVGVAVLSLEDVLADGKDHRGALRVLNGKKVEVGKLSVNVKALAALKAIDKGAEQGAPVVVRVSELHLLRGEGRETFVEIDMLGDEKQTAAQLPRGGLCHRRRP